MKILAIETSCDETACAVVEDGVQELASVVASSADLHMNTGGIVPEVAARKQAEFIVPVIEKCMEEARCNKEDIDALAVTYGPGLIGSLIVGVETAKTLSLAWDKPLIPVNHLVGHIYANWIGIEADVGGEKTSPEFPAIVLIVSGGHTDLVLMRGHGDLEYLGGTLDDAAGEAFDKTARLLGLSKYLGGKELSDLAATCKDNILAGCLPRPVLTSGDFDFSFSGLKTAAKRLIESGEYAREVIACEFETAVVDVLVEKTLAAVKKHKVKAVLLGGGVSANTQLRSRLKFEVANLSESISVHISPLSLCTDNAVYIASAAYFNNTPRDISGIDPNPSLGIVV